MVKSRSLLRSFRLGLALAHLLRRSNDLGPRPPFGSHGLSDRKTCLLLKRLESVLDRNLLDLPVFDVDRDLSAEDCYFDLELALVGINH